MNNIEILDAFLEKRGLARSATAKGNIKCLIPFLLMDCVYQIYDKEIRPLSLRPHSGVWKRREQWRRAYNTFNKDFFDSMGVAGEGMVDKMDSFGEYMRNDLSMMQAVAWRHLQRCEPDRDSVVQNVGAWCFLAETLSCIAFVQSERLMDYARTFSKGMQFVVVKRPKELVDTFKGIDEVRRKVNAFNNEFYRPTTDVNLSRSPEFDGALVQLLSHIGKFVVKDLAEDMEKEGRS